MEDNRDSIETATLDEIAETLEGRECNLFLGAGPSIAAGGPSWPKLSRQLAEHIGYRGGDPEDWWDVVDEALARKTLDDVYLFVAGTLEGIPVPTWMEGLLALDWREIYTTNYDATFRALRSLPPTGRPPHIYYAGDVPEGDATDRKPIFHLMGCMDRQPAETGSMMLSRQDLMLRAAEIVPYYKRIKDALDSEYPLVVVGHSLNDGVLQQALKSTASALPTGRSGVVFIVTPSPPNQRALRGLSNLRVVHVPATAEALSARLAVMTVRAPRPATRVVKYGTREFPLGPQSTRLIGRAGQLIDKAEPGAQHLTRDKFYESSVYVRKAFEENWDFRRDILSATEQSSSSYSTTEVRRQFEKLIENRGFGLALLEGGPGAAKTMTALRLAYEWTVQGQIAFYFDANRHSGQGDAVAGLVGSVHHDALSAFVQESHTPSYLVILDNFAGTWHMVQDAVSQMRRSGVPKVAVLVLGRLNECPYDARESIDLHYRLSSIITPGERERLPSFVASASGRAPEDIAEAMKITDSYWALIWKLIDPTRPPLEGAVKAIYGSLNGWERDLAACAAVFSGLGMPLLLRWGRRLPVGVDLTIVYRSIDKGPISNLVIRRSDESGDSLEFLNPTAAIQLVNNSIRGSHGCAGYIRRVISAASPDFEGADALEEALIAGLSRNNLRDPRLRDWINKGEREILLRLASEKLQTTVIRHHHAIALKDLGAFQEAEEELRRALREAKPRQGRHIRHTMASLYTRWAETVSADDRALARRLLNSAKDHLDHSSQEEASYFYTALARWHLAMSQMSGEDLGFHVTQAILQCKFGRSLERTVVRRELFDKIEDDAYALMGKSSFGSEDALRIATKFRSGVGFYVMAVRITESSILNDVPHAAREEALALLNEALKISPTMEAAWDLRLRLTRSLDPQNVVALRDIVDRLATTELRCHAILVLAAAEQEQGNLKEANRLMKEAARIDAGYEPPADRAADLVLRENTEPKQWEVRGHESAPYLVVDGTRIPLQHATPGTRWQVRVHQDGPKAHRRV